MAFAKEVIAMVIGGLKIQAFLSEKNARNIAERFKIEGYDVASYNWERGVLVLRKGGFYLEVDYKLRTVRIIDEEKGEERKYSFEEIEGIERFIKPLPRPKFSVEYDYDHFNKWCEATITLYLPREGKKLALVLRNPEVKIFDEVLTDNWGSYTEDETYRFKKIRVYANTWEELEKEVQRIKEEVIATLRSVIKENLKILQGMPKDESEFVEFEKIL